MSKYNRLALVLGNCLFESHSDLKPENSTLFFMAEDENLCNYFKFHKHKLVLFLSAMRNHRDEISKKYSIIYSKLSEKNIMLSYEDKLQKVVDKYSISSIVTYDIEDKFFDKRIRDFCLRNKIELEVVSSKGFLTSHEDFKLYRKKYSRLFFNDFYIFQRKRLNILLDEFGKPLHGKWSFDSDNRKKVPKGLEIPDLKFVKGNCNVDDVKELVSKLFSSHPGDVSNFYLPTTHNEGKKWLNDFLKERFNNFGPYEDAIESEKGYEFLFHSLLTPMLNTGLLTPKFVVDESLKFYFENEKDINFSSVEGFIRQVIGWREFMRGVYNTENLSGNFFNHGRKLTKDWYEGTTGILPVDDAIRKVNKFGYLHHIERLMVVGNFMLLCEIDPDEVYKWFMEYFVDSLDWVMAGNVFGMSQFSDGGSFATKPYIGGSNYIVKMSNYKKGFEGSDIWDGLYWKFIDNNREFFSSNPRMGMMVKLLDKMDNDKKKFLFGLASGFLKEKTL